MCPMWIPDEDLAAPGPEGQRRFDAARSGKEISVKSRKGHSATRRTVIIAGAANMVVGLAKLVAGILSGSSAMLAEAAHSAADTLNQVFLLTSLRQADRPADDDHPFGHGQERYFWALLAAFGIFIAGAGFSIFEGLLSLTRSHSESPLAAYVTLAVAFVAEGISFVRAFWQVRGEAGGRSEEVLGHVESSPDITVKVNLFEDSAAVVGLILAALGVGLGQLTGSPVWDGAASIAIGVLLVVVAIKLGMDSRDLLIGRAAGSEVQQLIREGIESQPGVDELLELRTMHMGPDSLIVAARVALNDEMGANQAEDLADEIDRSLSEKLPLQLNVFIDPTQTRQSGAGRPAGSAGRPPGLDAAGTRAAP
jgi:cation diffusion facilitator family transporter